MGNPTKTYDGSDTVALGPTNFQLSGFVNGQGATVTQTHGRYASPNPSTALPVSAALSPGDFSAQGTTRLANYALPTEALGVGTIRALPGYHGALGLPSRMVQLGYNVPSDNRAFLLDPLLHTNLTKPSSTQPLHFRVSGGGVNAPGAACHATGTWTPFAPLPRTPGGWCP